MPIEDTELKTAQSYVFQTKEEWKSVVAKKNDWVEKARGIKLAFARGEQLKQNVAILDKYRKEADADHWLDGDGNLRRYRKWLWNQLVELKKIPGIWVEYGQESFLDQARPLVVGKKGWMAEKAPVADPKNEQTKAEAAAVNEVNSSLSPDDEEYFKQRYDKSQNAYSLGEDFVLATTIGDVERDIESLKKNDLETERLLNISKGKNGTDSEKFRQIQAEIAKLDQYKQKLVNEQKEREAEEAKKQPPPPKITEKKEKEIKQSIDEGKKTEEKRQEQKEEKRQQAISTGVAPQPEAEKCPCGTKLSNEQKDALNWGRNNPVFQNPVASQINNAQGGFADSLNKINSVTGILGSISGAPTDQLSKLTNTVGNMQGALSSYSSASNSLCGLGGGGPDLLSLVSTVGAAVNFQCALGIEGLDVGAKVGLVTENGKLKLNVAINVNADLGKLMDKLASALPGDTGASDALQKAKDAIAGVQAEIAKITNKLNEIAGDINNAIAELNKMYNDALDFVTQFTNINFALNFSNDPCTKFGVGFQQGILNPAFIEKARAANPLNKAANPGFGTSFR